MRIRRELRPEARAQPATSSRFDAPSGSPLDCIGIAKEGAPCGFPLALQGETPVSTKEVTAIRVSEEEALRFHSEGQPGKLAVSATKALATQLDLSLAYSPGVAFPCLHI